jgi:hypothetical protein
MIRRPKTLVERSDDAITDPGGAEAIQEGLA